MTNSRKSEWRPWSGKRNWRMHFLVLLKEGKEDLIKEYVVASEVGRKTYDQGIFFKDLVDSPTMKRWETTYIICNTPKVCIWLCTCERLGLCLYRWISWRKACWLPIHLIRIDWLFLIFYIKGYWGFESEALPGETSSWHFVLISESLKLERWCWFLSSILVTHLDFGFVVNK